MPNNGKVHLVGSIPGESSGEVFRQCGESVGELLATIPDGETGYRRAYINFLAYKIYRPHPDIEVVSQPLPLDPDDPAEWRKPGEEWLGREADLSDLWKFKLRDAVKTLRFDTLGYADLAIASYRDFNEARSAGKVPAGVRFQISLPASIDGVGPFVTRYQDFPKFVAAYEAAMASDLKKIFAAIPAADLAIQWDNVSNVMQHEMEKTGQGVRMPFKVPFFVKLLMGSPTKRYRKLLQRFARLIPDDVLFGIHLCYGDLGHKHGTEPSDLAVCVHLANEAVESAGRSVDWVHMPVPRDRFDEAYFKALAQMNRNTRLFLGLVHHTDGIEGTQRRIATAKKFVSNFGVATECGFGRRPIDQIPALLDIHRHAVKALNA